MFFIGQHTGEELMNNYELHFDIDDLIISTTRYYLGRSTISVSCFCDQLIDAWDNLPERVKRIVERDVESEFERTSRETGVSGIPAYIGHKCDHEKWEEVRSLWSTED